MTNLTTDLDVAIELKIFAYNSLIKVIKLAHSHHTFQAFSIPQSQADC